MQKFKLKTALAVFSLSALSGVASATDTGTIGDLSRIQAETILIKAKAKREEARNELQAKSVSVTDGDGTVPVVSRIINNEITFLYANNVKVPARVGDLIPGGFKVAAVNEASRAVSLRKGSETYVVGFSDVVPSMKKTERNAGMMGMPPMGMMPPIR